MTVSSDEARVAAAAHCDDHQGFDSGFAYVPQSIEIHYRHYFKEYATQCCHDDDSGDCGNGYRRGFVKVSNQT